MRLPKELNSQVPVKQAEPYADTTLESPLNGRRRCTNIVDVLISQANGQSNSSSSAAFKAGEYLYRFLPTGVVVIPVGFCFLFRKWEEGEFYVGAFE